MLIHRTCSLARNKLFPMNKEFLVIPGASKFEFSGDIYVYICFTQMSEQ